MPLVQTRGAASAQGFGEFSQQTAANFIEDVFSTYLYTGNGSTQTITNGIDLAGKGGLVWVKTRTTNTGGGTYNNSHILADSARTPSNILRTNGDEAQDGSPSFSSFNSNGFTLGTSANTNNTGVNSVSWTFRKQAKFFDIVTYTGNGVSGRTVAHNLGSKPGAIFVKATSTTSDWSCMVRASDTTYASFLSLNTTGASAYTGVLGDPPTTTEFTTNSLGNSAGTYTPNVNGVTYVAYLFAHNAGGFGASGTDNVISCGSFTTDGSGNATVSLGYEPQWILVKTSGVSGSWRLIDTMRGWSMSANDAFLNAESSAAESNDAFGNPTATGFLFGPASASTTYIYIAIRRGPMKTPTSGTSVYYPFARAGNDTQTDITGVGFTPDLWLVKTRNIGAAFPFFDRLRGVTKRVESNSTNAEETFSGSNGLVSLNMDGITIGAGALDGGICNDTGANYGNWLFKRAPGFFDEVCYTGTGANQNITHNLGVAPELVIVKSRSSNPGANWVVWNQTLNSSTGYLYLNGTLAGSNFAGVWNGAPTSTYFTLGTNYQNNGSGVTFVAYLFATVAGVSKVGSYTGNGGTQAIACGFTGGARFVLIKRTDSTGDWYVYDTARGMTVLTDPYLWLNSTLAETATLGSVTTTTGGFTVDAAILADINTNAASYIFLAIA